MHVEIAKLVGSGKLTREVGEKLSNLQPGTSVFHKSWGAGRISDWDLTGDQLSIDFEGRKQHAMRLAFAAGALQSLPADHILSRWIEKPTDIEAMAKEKPMDFVRLILDSYGRTMHLDNFDSVVKGKIIPEKNYKAWWENTKKVLKTDRRFVVPSKRTEKLHFRGDDKSPAEMMSSTLLEARDLKAKLKALDVIFKGLEEYKNPTEELAPIIKDVDATCRRSIKMQAQVGNTLELLALRDDLISATKMEAPDVFPLADAVKLAHTNRNDVTGKTHLQEFAPILGASAQRRVFDTFPTAFGDTWCKTSISFMNQAKDRGVTELARVLNANGKEEELAKHLHDALNNRSISTEMLIWICRERKGPAKNLFNYELSHALFSVMERDHYDEDKKANPIGNLFVEDQDLLPDLAREADIEDARNLARRVLNSPAFDPLTRRSHMAKMLKVHEELSDLVDTDSSNSSDKGDLLVSWASLEDRKQALEQLVQVEIPKNVKEIQIARDFGDLRENFEFKAAKQQQAVLNRKKVMLERDINNARGTDFKGVNAEVVSIGTVVNVETNKGKKHTYTILGAWDTDPANHVLSYLSDTAKALIGKPVNEEVELPGESSSGGTRKVKILDIQPYAK